VRNSDTSAQRWLAPNELGLSTDGFVTEIPLLHSGSGPTTIAIDGDGTVWFTESSGNRIGRVNPDGTDLIEYPLPNADSSPRVMALGGDGNVWFSEHSGNRIGRIGRNGELAEFALPTAASQPRALAAGADGNVWVGLFGAGTIARVTPRGTITEFAIPTPHSGPRALAVGPDGDIWFSQYHANKIGRLTPRGDVFELALPRPNSGPGDITVGADGALWFVELSGPMDGREPDGARVGRIGTDGAITELAMPGRVPSPINIAVGPDRNVWYTRGAALGCVRPDGRIVELPLARGARAVGLTAGSDRQPPRRLVNRLWFADGARDKLCFLSFR
jgi:virginiamycin B lyase